MLEKTDANKDGNLMGEETAKVLEAMTKVDVKPSEANTVSKDEFLVQCMKDTFAGME